MWARLWAWIEEEERGRFLKKAAQNFCYAGPGAASPTTPMAQHNKVFLLLFVHKK
jgi:hypothetical protein